MNRVALDSLGCKLNQAETESLACQLLDRGYQLAETAGEADVYVLNTCTVTHVADRKARQLLRSAHRSNPRATIVAIGCYAQRARDELGQLGVVDLILDNREKGHLVEILEERSGPGNGSAKTPTCRNYRRTRSLIKIQEGCDSFCSFCIVPYARGQERSFPQEEVLQEIEDRVAAGYREVVLTGTRIGAYRWNGEGRNSLPGLIAHILEETGVERLRLSSLQPQDLTPDLVKLWADDRLCPHLHLPLQSGSQAILQPMNRDYSIADYQRAVSFARQAIPDLAVTTDIIVGFPGEEEREFEESYGFCEKMGFANIHVFPYSPRPGTAAATLPGQVDEPAKKERSQQMLALAQESARRFRSQFLGQTMTVLWENKAGQATWSGLTANYLRVFTDSQRDLTNRLVEVRLVDEDLQGLLGKLANGG